MLSEFFNSPCTLDVLKTHALFRILEYRLPIYCLYISQMIHHLHLSPFCVLTRNYVTYGVTGRMKVTFCFAKNAFEHIRYVEIDFMKYCEILMLTPGYGNL